MMSTTGSVHAEQLTSQDLAKIARAHWRELKSQLPDGPNKASMEAIISELTFRSENDPSNGQQYQNRGGTQYGGMSGSQQGTSQQGQQFAGVSSGSAGTKVPSVS